MEREKFVSKREIYVGLILRLFTCLALAYFFNVSFITSKETKKKKKNNAIARLRMHACMYLYYAIWRFKKRVLYANFSLLGYA